MKKIILHLVFLAALLDARADYITTNPPVSDSEIYLQVTNVDVPIYNGIYTNTFSGSNWPSSTFYSSTTNSLITFYPGVGWNFVVAGGYANYIDLNTNPTDPTGIYSPGLGTTNSPVISIYSPYVPPIVLFSGNLTNFWLTNGSRVAFNISGWNNSVTASNDFSIVLSSNVIFASPASCGRYHPFRVNGFLDFDGTNLATAVQYASGDPDNPIGSAFTTISNFSITTPNFAINLDATGDTNLLITAGRIESAVWVPGSGAAALDLVTSAAAINGTNGTNGTNGAPGTNTVTAYNLTNAWLSSFNNTLFATNNIVWGTSNFIGTFSSGFSSLNFSAGTSGPGGTDPTQTNINQNVCATTNGGSSWFIVCTNGGTLTFTTTNSVQVSVSGVGGGLGELEIYLLDHPELINRTNGGYGQHYSAQEPVNSSDVATKNYTDNAIANSMGGTFTLSTDTNGFQHSTLNVNGVAAIDVASSKNHLMRALGTSGTNILIYINVTNLTTGWTMQSTTNLAQNYSWTAFTNWTSVTTNVVGGVSNTVTFTIPKTLPGQPMRYFDPQGQQSSSMTIKLPTTLTFLSLTNYTVTSSTNSTLNLPVGSVALDTNYIYLVVGTNSGASNWRRLAWPTNGW